MKILSLSILIVGILSLVACGTPATTKTTTMDTTTVPTAKPTPEPSAIFTITSFNQNYSESSKKWDYVYIYFDVENNGTVFLDYYEVNFTITCDDGSKIQYWTNGTWVFVGEKWSNWGITDVGSKKVVSVEIANWKLTEGTIFPKVMYGITGTAHEVNVTLSNDTGGTEQYSNVSIPKRYYYALFTDSYLYVSAQNQGEDGTVRVSIYVDGKLFKTSSSSGAYVIATASGSK